MSRDVAYHRERGPALQPAERGVHDLPSDVGRLCDEALREPRGERDGSAVRTALRVRLADHEDSERAGWLVGQEFPVRLWQLGLAELRVPGEPHDGRPVCAPFGLEHGPLRAHVQDAQHHFGGERDHECQGQEGGDLEHEPPHPGTRHLRRRGDRLTRLRTHLHGVQNWKYMKGALVPIVPT